MYAIVLIVDFPGLISVAFSAEGLQSGNIIHLI